MHLNRIAEPAPYPSSEAGQPLTSFISEQSVWHVGELGEELDHDMQDDEQTDLIFSNESAMTAAEMSISPVRLDVFLRQSRLTPVLALRFTFPALRFGRACKCRGRPP